MSRNHTRIDKQAQNAQMAVLRAVGREFDRVNNHLMERTGEIVLLISGYLAYRIETMVERLDGNTPFSMRLRNRGNGIIKACDEFAKTIEPYIDGEEKHKAYLWFSDIISNALDSLFDDMHRDEPEATLQVTRRAKLRYHDPYMTDVKERTAAFEDGYCKGFMDAMGDFMKTVAELGETHEKLTVGIINDKITIKPIEQ